MSEITIQCYLLKITHKTINARVPAQLHLDITEVNLLAGMLSFYYRQRHYGLHQDAIILSLKIVTECVLVLWHINFGVYSFSTTWFSVGLYNFTKVLRSSGPCEEKKKAVSGNPDQSYCRRIANKLSFVYKQWARVEMGYCSTECFLQKIIYLEMLPTDNCKEIGLIDEHDKLQ